MNTDDACGEFTDAFVRQWRCTKPAGHYGERHTAVLPGVGSVTWGYLDYPDGTQHDDPRLPNFVLRSDERLVTSGLGDRWPALVDDADRWNGWLVPGFRPAVARRLAVYQAHWVARRERERDDYQQDQLVLSPDGRTIVHLVWDDDALINDDVNHLDTTDWPIRWLTTREHSVLQVFVLPPADHLAHVYVGAWHWCWTYADKHDEHVEEV